MKSRKKITTLIIAFLIIFASVGLLLNNRSKFQAKAKKNVILTTFPVNVARVAFEEINLTLEYTGNVLPNAEVSIASEASGKVVAVNANLGDFVSKGAVLIKLDDEMKLANLQTAEANYQKAKRDLERYEKLYAEKSAPESQLDQFKFLYETAEAQYKIAKKQVEDTKIRAPFSGFVTSKSVEVGAVVSSGTPLMNLVDISTVKVRIQVPEKDIMKIKKGDMVEITSDILPGEKMFGTIQSIGYKADEGKTYPVEIFVRNKNNLLKAGMFVRVKIPSAIRGRTLLMPREALVGSYQEPKVYVVENNVAKLRPIVIGSEIGKKLEILQGLREGELVVVEGLINLKDGTPVQIVE